MEITFSTYIVDVAVALNALKLYKSGEFKQAITCLLDILDVEPKNWDARLMLSACYYKTGQYATAQRSFKFICDNSPDGEVKSKARDGLQATNAKMEKKVDTPPEFGSYVARNPVRQAATWLD